MRLLFNMHACNVSAKIAVMQPLETSSQNRRFNVPTRRFLHNRRRRGQYDIQFPTTLM